MRLPGGVERCCAAQVKGLWGRCCAAQCRKAATLIITRYNGSCAGIGTSPPGCVPKVRSCSEGFASSEGRTFGTHFVGVSTHPGTTALYRVMIGHATLWLLLCAAVQRGLEGNGVMGGASGQRTRL